MACMKETPADSRIWAPGRKVRRVLFSIDADVSEVMPAREQGMEAVSSYVRVGNVLVNLD